MELYIMKMGPAFVDYLWGGTRLVTEFGKQTDLERVAESWEISCHPAGLSTVENGAWAGRTLAAVLADHPKLAGTKASAFPGFPILVKLIDAKQDLSLQVHPGDEYAMKVEGETGKNEMWYVMDCDPGAEIILGFRHPISRETFRKGIEENTILEDVNRIPVQRGDCFCIPAGMIHAIGKGMLIAEVQQSSNVTYRVYDYDRRGADGNPRELHIEKALDVTDTSVTGGRVTTQPVPVGGGRVRQLTDWEYFSARELQIDGEMPLNCGADSFHSMVCVAGELTLRAGEEALSLCRGESVFVPAGLGQYSIAGAGAVLFTQI
ncbi:class I mannose-6-phosphate isomerase [Ruminococcaceae bacterium OttesenSCG-928-L11]|nr:class I mannose-6-phosphate isomerase [Ruminococcaceae bacterium OttesenSCG-928-L11]